MKIEHSFYLVILITGSLCFCAHSEEPKLIQASVTTNAPSWEYKYLDGDGSESSPEGEKLKKDGWVFVHYRLTNNQDIICAGGSPEIERKMHDGVIIDHRQVQAVFKRERK